MAKLIKIEPANKRIEVSTSCRTIYSSALGIDKSQLKEAMEMYPDEHYVWNEKQGLYALEIKGERQREKYAKRHGMVIR
jgi:hypothetical protein